MGSAFLISFNLRHLCFLTLLAWEAKQSGWHHAVLKTAFSFRSLRLDYWVKFIIPPSPLLQDLPEGFKTPRANRCLLGSKLYSWTWSNTSKHQGWVQFKLKLEPSLHAATDDLCVVDHSVGGGGKERQLKNGWHPGGVFTQLGDRALYFCLYNEDIEQDAPLGGPTASYFPNQRSNLHPLPWKCEFLPQDHRRSPWTVMCLFNTNISWFWRIALRGNSSYILEKSIYSVLTGYIFEDCKRAFPLLKTFFIPSCIYRCWEISRHSDFWWKCSMLCMEMFFLKKLFIAAYEKCFTVSLCFASFSVCMLGILWTVSA